MLEPSKIGQKGDKKDKIFTLKTYKELFINFIKNKKILLPDTLFRCKPAPPILFSSTNYTIIKQKIKSFVVNCGKVESISVFLRPY